MISVEEIIKNFTDSDRQIYNDAMDATASSQFIKMIGSAQLIQAISENDVEILNEFENYDYLRNEIYSNIVNYCMLLIKEVYEFHVFSLTELIEVAKSSVKKAKDLYINKVIDYYNGLVLHMPEDYKIYIIKYCKSSIKRYANKIVKKSPDYLKYLEEIKKTWS